MILLSLVQQTNDLDGKQVGAVQYCESRGKAEAAGKRGAPAGEALARSWSEIIKLDQNSQIRL